MPADRKRIRFRLNMQIIADGLQKKYQDYLFYKGNDEDTLEGVCFLTEASGISEKYVYIVRDQALLPEDPGGHRSFIMFGSVPPLYQRRSDSIIQLPAEADLFDVLNVCQGIFRENREWEESLHEIVMKDGSVEDLCQISYRYFRNPLFVHDAQLNVLACPVWREGMINWRTDRWTGQISIPFEIINEFKMDQEYVHTLTTHGADIFSADLRGHRDLYVNLWNPFGRYDGRLVICELESALKPGQFIASEFLAGMVKLVLARRGSLEHTYRHELDRLFTDLIGGEFHPDSDISARIAAIGWHMEDEYVCMRVNVEERDYHLTSTGNVCDYMEAQITGSKAFYDEEKICVIINISLNRNYTTEAAYILRDGLFKAGFSNTFRGMSDLNGYYKQASIALKYCLLKNDSNWYRTFGSIAMDYFADNCSSDLDVRFYCDAALVKLEEYDEENATEFYKTLKVYLLNERNTVKTASELYIGRSTLFYRLRKIREITGLDTNHLAEAERNLYLRLSFYMMERGRRTDSSE